MLEQATKAFDGTLATLVKSGLKKGLYGVVLFCAGVSLRFLMGQFLQMEGWEGAAYKVVCLIFILSGGALFAWVGWIEAHKKDEIPSQETEAIQQDTTPAITDGKAASPDATTAFITPRAAKNS